MKLRDRLDHAWYPGVERNWDDLVFRQAILDRLRPEHVLLDLGAGAGIVREMNFRGIASMACGIDPDERVLQNPFLDDARVGTVEKIDYADEQFDVVFADNVLEHLPEPQTAFSEIYRVLKPGGSFFFKTPNKFHYMPAIASLTPTRFHKYVNSKRGRDAEDTFPTLYRANSKRRIEKLARATGFEVVAIRRIEGRPEYLRFSVPTYCVGWLYEKLVNSAEWFSVFRILLVGCLIKPRDNPDTAS